MTLYVTFNLYVGVHVRDKVINAFATYNLGYLIGSASLRAYQKPNKQNVGSVIYLTARDQIETFLEVQD